MFKKIELSFENLDLLNHKGEVSFVAGKFREFTILEREKLIEKIESIITFKIKPDIVNITEITYPGAGPHTDTWPVALNLYLTASDDITYFWEQHKNASLPNYGTVGRFNEEHLSIAGSFIASRGESYLLNTKAIHSVKLVKENSSRVMLRFAWKYFSFDEVLDSISINNT